ncbi:MAG: YfhO family protein [Anaerolineae bacterium]|nr:YfhO family protein [Anaerolineae bacterium]
MKPWSRIDWFILILLAALVTLFYWRILTPDLADRQSFPPGDFSAQFWAFTTFEARELSAGRLPLWNPYTFAGAPFWADVQAAVFYPPSLLTLLLSAPGGFSLFALEVEAVVHFWLAATLMYLFIREITQNRPAAFIAALVFTFSGYLTGYPGQQLAVLETDVWLPLILFFIYQASQRVDKLPPPALPYPSPIPSLLLAGLAWGLALLAGHPQSALIIAYVSTAYFFFLWLAGGQESGVRGRTAHFTFHVLSIVRTCGYWLIFIVTGLALAAIQFIPAVEYTLLSVRSAGTYEQMSGGFPLPDIIQFLLPGQLSLYSPLYVGVVGLVLALWVIFAHPSRHTTFWAVVAMVALLISFGGNTFFYSPLYLFTPGFSIFRGQERWAFGVAFGLSVLAGYGFKELVRQVTHNTSPHVPHSLLRFTQYLFFFALLLTFLFFFGLNYTGWTPASPFYNLLGAATLLTLLLILTWLLWRFSTRLHPVIFTGLAAGLICFDLFTANWQTNLYPQLPEWHTQMPDTVAAIKQDAATAPGEPYRVYNEFRLYDNYGVPFEIEDLWGASPLRPDRYDKFLAPPMPIERTWELLNVKYVITWREELYLPSTIIYQEPVDDGSTTYVHRLDNVGPRAWLVNQAQIADDATILQKIADPNFDRWRIALLEVEAVPYIAPISQSANRQSPDQAPRFTQYSPQFITVQVTTDLPALLILSETSYPGWRAAIDDQPAPLLRADYILRAVPVPPGEHAVELTFRPLTFTVGAIVSGLAALVVIGLVLFYRRRSAT